MSRCWGGEGRPLGMRLLLGAAMFLAMAALPRPALSQTYTKHVDRRYPAFWCPIDPALTLTFTAARSDAILTFATNNYTDGTWNGQSIDNIAVVEQSVFQANQFPTPGFGDCYFPPGTSNTPGYDFRAAGTPEVFLDLLDTNAAGWNLGRYGFFQNSGSAPRD